MVLVALRGIATHYLIRVASTSIHNKMADCLTRAPSSFFDKTPLGTILNRFSSDLALVDRFISLPLIYFIEGILLFVSQTIVICRFNFLVLIPSVGLL